MLLFSSSCWFPMVSISVCTFSRLLLHCVWRTMGVFGESSGRSQKLWSSTRNSAARRSSLLGSSCSSFSTRYTPSAFSTVSFACSRPYQSRRNGVGATRMHFTYMSSNMDSTAISQARFQSSGSRLPCVSIWQNRQCSTMCRYARFTCTRPLWYRSQT